MFCYKDIKEEDMNETQRVCSNSKCYLLEYDTPMKKTKLCCEVLVVFFGLLYILQVRF